MPEVLASTCGTLLSSQVSDAHLIHTLSGRIWGNPSTLLSPSYLVKTLVGVSPGPQEGLHLTSSGPQARPSLSLMSGSHLLEFAGPCSVPRAFAPSLATGKTLGGPRHNVKSPVTRACREHRAWYCLNSARLRPVRYPIARRSPVVFFPRRNTYQPPARAPCNDSSASASSTLTLLTYAPPSWAARRAAPLDSTTPAATKASATVNWGEPSTPPSSFATPASVASSRAAS